MPGNGSLERIRRTMAHLRRIRLRRLAANLAASLTAVLAAWGQPALAQAYQCRMPAQVAVPLTVPDGPVRQLPVSGYTLALSWSPEFCKDRELRGGNRMQCSGANGRFGFVVHGLWPESRRGSSATWPQWCQAGSALTPAETRRNLCMIPSSSLIARQWAKHGSCMTRRPETYFKVTRILWDSLRFPDMDRLSRQPGLTAGDIRSAIASANSGIEPGNIDIELDRNGWLEVVRICYGKRFRPAVCDRRRYGAGEKAAAKIWRGL
ncbi:ribonuclease T2 family protein [Allopontixanthobacter sp.]|uniref:ribonuclease T2 family protein n=1 Tax=Allopontixanthobacter sp. TaxID=2906452 RepID=UPI002ABC4BCB|nr:ribonuclease T [Allopontixanthobacter sp.]MDZ4308654.1 ribonuclease T [Allopontixanthobacter sp.]